MWVPILHRKDGSLDPPAWGRGKPFIAFEGRKGPPLGGFAIFKPEKEKTCEKCGAELVFFLQHAHGNYPLLDYMCPNCDLGEVEFPELSESEDEG